MREQGRLSVEGLHIDSVVDLAAYRRLRGVEEAVGHSAGNGRESTSAVIFLFNAALARRKQEALEESYRRHPSGYFPPEGPSSA